MMTEEEAKKKWCPFAGTRFIVESNGKPSDRCLASVCMAWRSRETFEQVRVGVWRRPTFKTGFCGLAGKDGT